MLTNAKVQANADFMDGAEDNLLDDNDNKPVDIIAHGEKIADVLGKVKTMNVNLLASQLSQLQLEFQQGTIDALANVATCKAIEGVEVSQEELEALKEAADANAGLANEAEDLKNEFASMSLNNQKEAQMVAQKPPRNVQPTVLQSAPKMKYDEPPVFNQAPPVTNSNFMAMDTNNFQQEQQQQL